MKAVREINGEEFGHAIEAATEPVLVHFYTSWSGMSQIIAPMLERLGDELKAELLVARVSVDHCPDLARRYATTGIPALVLFDRGAPKASLDASLSPRQMKAQLLGLLAT